MFALVQFDNEEFYICKATNIIVKGDDNIVRYKGSRYTAKIVANHVDKQELSKLKDKLEMEIENQYDSEDSSPNMNKESITLNVGGDKFENDFASDGDQKKSLRDENTCENFETIEIKSIQPQEHLTNISNLDGPITDPKYLGKDELSGNISIQDIDHDHKSSVFESITGARGNKPTIIEDRLLKNNIIIHQNTLRNERQFHIENLNNSKNSNCAPDLSSFELLPGEAMNTSLLETAQILMDSSNVLWDEMLLNLDNNNTRTVMTPGQSLTNVTLKSEQSTTVYNNLDGPMESEVNTETYDPIGTAVKLEIFREGEEDFNGSIGQNDERETSDESEYVPDSDDSCETNHEKKVEKARPKSSGNKRSNISGSLGDSSTHFNSLRSTNTFGNSAPDDINLHVATVESGSKKDFCIYCNTQQVKLSRHVVRIHKFEERVAEYLSFPKGSKERKQIMTSIRKRGHYAFNTNDALNTGERKVMRRPNVRYGKKATDFATCPTCLGDYARNTLRHHVRRCTMRGKNQRNILIDSKRVTGRIHKKASNVLRQRVFPTLQDDDVVRAIRYDELVILFGNKLCQKYKDPHFYDMIRQKLRQLGRFLLQVRKYTENVHDFFSLFYPKNYDVTLRAVQMIAGLNDTETGFKRPSLATSVGTLLKQIGKLCISEWIKRHEKDKQMYAEDYLKLLTEDYTTSIACTALESYARQKRQKKILLPSKEDIQKLQIYLRDQLRKNYRDLQINFSDETWMSLASLTLISLQLFNRRRPGETERILINDFINYEMIDHVNVGDAFDKLSEEEKQAAKNYVRFVIRGKLNRTVPILMHVELVRSVELLIQLRKQAGVDENNPYLFGIPGKLKGDFKYLRGCDLIRRYAVACGAKKPETLRGTILRKHVATMCINFNLTDGEVSDLADFMGHAERIHKEHYRQPIIARDILKISKLLEAVQGPANDSASENEDETDEAIPSTTTDHPDTNNVSINTALLSPQLSSHLEEKEVQRSRKTRSSKACENMQIRNSTSPYGKCKRTRWTDEEKEIVLGEFKEDIQACKLPSFKKIEDFVGRNRKLAGRNIASIKTWISNQIKKNGL